MLRRMLSEELATMGERDRSERRRRSEATVASKREESGREQHGGGSGEGGDGGGKSEMSQREPAGMCDLSLPQPRLHPLMRRPPPFELVESAFDSPRMTKRRQGGKEGSGREESVDRHSVQRRGEAQVEIESAKTTQAVEIRKLRRRQSEVAVKCQLHQRLRDGTRREASQRLERSPANRQLLECELREQSRPVC